MQWVVELSQLWVAARTAYWRAYEAYHATGPAECWSACSSSLSAAEKAASTSLALHMVLERWAVQSYHRWRAGQLLHMHSG